MKGNGAMIQKMGEEQDDTGDNEYYHCDMYMYMYFIQFWQRLRGNMEKPPSSWTWYDALEGRGREVHWRLG